MSDDGRLHLDDLGEVIDGAAAIDEVIGTEDAGPTLSERLESSGVSPFLRRHRRVLAGTAVVVVGLAAWAWAGRDTRPPDDGRVRAAVTDSFTQQGIDQNGTTLKATYEVVRQQTSDAVTLLGITGPGLTRSTVGPTTQDAADPARATTDVTATLDCDDPKALLAQEDQYRLLLRRTDSYGRAVEQAVPTPVGSQARWASSVSGACLQKALGTRLTVTSVGVTPLPRRRALRLDLTLTSSLDVGVSISTEGYSGVQVRPEQTGQVVPAKGTAVLRVEESVQDCSAPHIQGTLVAADGTGTGVEDRTLDVLATVIQADAPTDVTGTSATLTWSEADGRRVGSALDALCQGLPSWTWRTLSSRLAPAEVVEQVRTVYDHDPSINVVRTVLEIRSTATTVTAGDVLSASEIEQGNNPTIVPVDLATGTRRAPARPVPVRTVSGTARVAFDWTFSCGGSNPPTVRLLLSKDGRTWPVWLYLDERNIAAVIVRTCGTSPDDLRNYGWSSVPAA